MLIRSLEVVGTVGAGVEVRAGAVVALDDDDRRGRGRGEDAVDRPLDPARDVSDLVAVAPRVIVRAAVTLRCAHQPSLSLKRVGASRARDVPAVGPEDERRVGRDDVGEGERRRVRRMRSGGQVVEDLEDPLAMHPVGLVRRPVWPSRSQSGVWSATRAWKVRRLTGRGEGQSRRRTTRSRRSRRRT